MTMPNRSGLLQIDAALLGLEPCRSSPRQISAVPAASARSLANPARRARRRSARATACRPGAVAMHGAQIEEDVDRQQVLRGRTCRPSRRSAPPCRERAAPWRVLRHDAAAAIGHADLVQDVGDAAAKAANQRSSARPARLRRTPAHCPGRSRAGSRRGRPSPAPRARKDTAARRGPCSACAPRQ